MKAIIQDRYGSPDVLEVTHIDKPAVQDDEVLVRIRAAAADPKDWRMMRGHPYLMRTSVRGLRTPPKGTVPGGDMAGVVEAVGKNVTRFRPGDEVYAEVSVGGFAEYVGCRDDRLALKPADLTFEQAAEKVLEDAQPLRDNVVSLATRRR